MVAGALPWKAEREGDAVANWKKKTSHGELCHGLSTALVQLPHYLDSLAYDDTPDYSRINALLVRCLPEALPADAPFDWETETTATTMSSGSDQPLPTAAPHHHH